MAKGARASTKKANNARLKSGVFGPVESARNERLSAKLLELASQPKPKKDDVVMEVEGMFPDVVRGQNLIGNSRYFGREQRCPSI
jgi:hypothetical protein